MQTSRNFHKNLLIYFYPRIYFTILSVFSEKEGLTQTHEDNIEEVAVNTPMWRNEDERHDKAAADSSHSSTNDSPSNDDVVKLNAKMKGAFTWFSGVMAPTLRRAQRCKFHNKVLLRDLMQK